MNEPAPIQTTLNSRTLLALIFLSILWGGSFYFVEITLDAFTPLTIAAGRVLLGCTALLLFLSACRRLSELPWNAALPFIALGALNNALPFVLIAWAQQEISSGVASILNATTPIWAILVAHVWLADEPLARHRFAAVIMGIIGVAVLIGPAALDGLNATTTALAAMLLATFCYGCAGVYARRMGNYSPAIFATGQLAGSSLVLVPVAFILANPITELSAASAPAFAALLALGVFSTGMAYVIYFRILRSSGATNVLLVTFLVPVTAILLGVTLLHETLAPNHLAGMAIIMAALVLIDGRMLARLAR